MICGGRPWADVSFSNQKSEIINQTFHRVAVALGNLQFRIPRLFFIG
jgi:hypothetical protein